MKFNFLILTLAIIGFTSCQKENLAKKDSQNLIQQSHITPCQTTNLQLKAIDEFIFSFNEVSKAMFESSESLSAATIQSKLQLLENQNDYSEFESLFVTEFSIPTDKLQDLYDKRLNLALHLDVDTNEESKILFQNRFDQLIANDCIDISYYELIDFDGVSARQTCLQVAIMGIGGAALITAGGAATANPFAVAYGFLSLGNAIYTMASGGCN